MKEHLKFALKVGIALVIVFFVLDLLETLTPLPAKSIILAPFRFARSLIPGSGSNAPAASTGS